MLRPALVLGLPLLLLSPTARPAPAQFAGPMGGPMAPQKTRVASLDTAPDTLAAREAESLWDESISLDEVDVAIDQLDEFLQKELRGVGVFVNDGGLQVAGVDAATRIRVTLPTMPLRAALRKMLRPLGLRATIEDEGFVIGADFDELARRGIATEMSLHPQSEAEQRIHAALDLTVSVIAEEQPLRDVVDGLSEQLDIPILIDDRALEEIGLSSEEPLSVELKNLSLRSILRHALRGLDLTFQIADEVMQITTIEAAEQNLVRRIYFLDGLGIIDGDATAVVDLIHATVVPDTWDRLGGPSTIQPFLPGTKNRPALVIGTTSDVHQHIRALLQGLRDARP